MNKVYGVTLSPAVRKVMVMLDHKGLDYELVQTLPFATPDGYEKLHPQRLVPAFEDEHTTIADSSVICAYLEDKYPETPLLPSDAVGKARVRWFERYADTRLFQLLLPGLFFERLVGPSMMKKPTDEELVEKSLSELPKEQDYLESQLQGDYLYGDSFSLADIAVATVFANAMFADYEVDAECWPKLSAYLQRMWAEPAFAPHMQEGAKVAAMLKG